VLACVALVWFVSLPGLTARRVPVWTSDGTLWADAAAWSSKPRPFINLAGVAFLEGRYAEAQRLYQQALVYAEGRPEAEKQLAIATAALGWSQAAWALGQYRMARLVARDVLILHPEWPHAQQWCQAVSCAP